MGSDAPTTMTCDVAAVRERARKSKPNWYLQVRDDKMIPYSAQQFMSKRAGHAVVEVPGQPLENASRRFAALTSRASRSSGDSSEPRICRTRSRPTTLGRDRSPRRDSFCQ
jgi:hypothetical protein